MWRRLLSTTAILLMAVTPAEAGIFSFTTIDASYPGTSATYAAGINDKGQVVGWYYTIQTGLIPHAFVLTDGQFATYHFDPSATCCSDFHDINNRGQIVGYGGKASFLFEAGQFSVFDIPGSRFTQANAINDSGTIVGTAGFGATNVGFLWKDDTLSFISVPGAQQTLATEINDAGDIVGGFSGDDFRQHGFLLRNGAFSSIDFPGSYSSTLTGINNAGEIVGNYSNTGSGYPSHGFLVRTEGLYVIDFPGAISTAVYGINNNSEIVGWYQDEGGDQHGFVAKINVSLRNVNDLVRLRENEVITSFDRRPVPNGVAGRFQIVVKFDNGSGVDICHPLFQVVELSGANQLEAVWLDSAGVQIQGFGGVVLGNGPAVIRSGATAEFRILVDLSTTDPFTLLVNMWGTPTATGNAACGRGD